MSESVGRRERKKLLSRKAIIDAAVHEFSTRGFKETSVADIMNAADLGIGTFYNYFESKEEILSFLLNDLVTAMKERLDELEKENSSVSDMLATAGMLTAKLLDENRFVLPLFLSATEHAMARAGTAANGMMVHMAAGAAAGHPGPMPAGHPGTTPSNPHAAMMRGRPAGGSPHSKGAAPHKPIAAPQLRGMFHNLIKAGQEKGEFRTDIPTDVIVEMFHSLYQAAAFSHLQVPFQDNVGYKLKLILDGIKTMK